jgi:hypothetical protein
MLAISASMGMPSGDTAGSAQPWFMSTTRRAGCDPSPTRWLKPIRW